MDTAAADPLECDSNRWGQALALVDKGQLNEDVNGSNILVDASGQIVEPADVNPTATNYPLAIIYDADGTVINALFGATTSQPDACQNNGVYVWMDNLNTDATIAHAVILLNGLCTGNNNMLEMMSYQLGTLCFRAVFLRAGLLTNKSRRAQQRRARWPVGLAGDAAPERHVRR